MIAQRQKVIARDILKAYDGSLAFDQYLRQVFRKNKQFGSRDRRFYRDFIYAWFRSGQWCLDEELKWEVSAFLLHLDALYPNSFLSHQYSSLQSCAQQENRWSCLREKFFDDLDLQNIFPAFDELSELFRADSPEWLFQQPQLWFRLVNEKHAHLIPDAIPANFPNAYSLSERKNLNQLLPEEAYEIQDIASQKAAASVHLDPDSKVWDCCAGSGGKSLFISDHYGTKNIWCSDIRENSLQNLKQRFRSRTIQPYIFLHDPTSETQIDLPDFDVIIADVPCSGSGTWRRNPENLVFFQADKLKQYQELQRQIVKGAIRHLHQNGKLSFITCSMYAAENEQNIEWFEKELGLICKKSAYIDERQNGGDVLFTAELHLS